MWVCDVGPLWTSTQYTKPHKHTYHTTMILWLCVSKISKPQDHKMCTASQNRNFVILGMCVPLFVFDVCINVTGTPCVASIWTTSHILIFCYKVGLVLIRKPLLSSQTQGTIFWSICVILDTFRANTSNTNGSPWGVAPGGIHLYLACWCNKKQKHTNTIKKNTSVP